MNEKFNVNNSSDEDWTISTPNENLPLNQTIIEPIEEWGMTGKLVSPNKNDGWKMPEPEFRKSSGSSPEEISEHSIKQEFQNSQPTISEPLPPKDEPNFDFETNNSASIFPQAAVAISDTIEAQPDISEAFAAAQIEIPPAPPKKKRSQGMRIFLAVFGIFAMFAFALIFLAVVYFLFFYKASIE